MFFPLDQKLKLRPDHWSDGAARVAARRQIQQVMRRRQLVPAVGVDKRTPLSTKSSVTLRVVEETGRECP